MSFNQNDIQSDDIFEEYKCVCPPFFYGAQCEKFTTPDFSMEFEKSSINNYVKLMAPDKNFHEVNLSQNIWLKSYFQRISLQLSFCAWIQTKDTFNYGSLLSYATPELDNAFTFTDYNGFVLYINGNNTITDIKIIDDVWHFICVSWSSDGGYFEIYLDGYLHTHGFNLSDSKPVSGNGVFVSRPLNILVYEQNLTDFVDHWTRTRHFEWWLQWDGIVCW